MQPYPYKRGGNDVDDMNVNKFNKLNKTAIDDSSHLYFNPSSVQNIYP